MRVDQSCITIASWAVQAKARLGSVTDCVELEARLILASILQKQPIYILAHADELMSKDNCLVADQMLKRRLAGEPMAYLLGVASFYSLDLKVNQHVLIPRPATEAMVDWLLCHYNVDNATVLDVGTGSGAIAIALAKHRLNWQVTAVDVSNEALNVARANIEAHQLQARVQCELMDGASAIEKESIDVFISNPPYIDVNDPECELAVRKYEPSKALYAEKNGLALIEQFALQAKQCLVDGGLFVCEHGARQQAQVLKFLQASGFKDVQGHCDWDGLERFVTAVR